VDERRDARAREGWKGGVLVERRFFADKVKVTESDGKDWGGLRRKSLTVR
jgi:hypothetical protein